MPTALTNDGGVSSGTTASGIPRTGRGFVPPPPSCHWPHTFPAPDQWGPGFWDFRSGEGNCCYHHTRALLKPKLCVEFIFLFSFSQSWVVGKPPKFSLTKNKHPFAPCDLLYFFASVFWWSHYLLVFPNYFYPVNETILASPFTDLISECHAQFSLEFLKSVSYV